MGTEATGTTPETGTTTPPPAGAGDNKTQAKSNNNGAGKAAPNVGDKTKAAPPSSILGGTDEAPSQTDPKAPPQQAKGKPAADAQKGTAAQKDGKEAGGKTPEGEAGEEGETGADDTAPEVDFEPTLPDGVEADEALLTPFKALVKEHGIKGEAAQKLVDLWVERQAAAEASTQESWKSQVQEWAEAAKKDPEIGGAKFQEAQAQARAVLKEYAPEGLIDYLNETGLGNYPPLVKLFARIGKANAEDSVAGTSASRKGKSEEESLYDLYPTMRPGYVQPGAPYPSKE